MFSIFLIIFSFILTPIGGIKTNSQDNYLKKEISNYLDKALSQYQGYDYEILQMPEAKSIKLLHKNELNIHKNLLYLPIEITDNYKQNAEFFYNIKIKIV